MYLYHKRIVGIVVISICEHSILIFSVNLNLKKMLLNKYFILLLHNNFHYYLTKSFLRLFLEKESIVLIS